MPEHNKKLAVTGLKRAEKEFEGYLVKRVAAEKSTVALERELDDVGREVGRALQNARGRRG